MREMKDSGIEWIGQVPNNWKLKKGKYLFKQHNNRGNLKCLQLLSPSQKFGVIPQTLLEELTTQNVVKVSEKANLNDFKTVHVGDFCISLRSFQGGFEYSHYEGVVSPAYQIFSAIGDNLCDGYYRYLFKDKSFIDKMNSYTMTLRDGKNIAFDDFGNTYIPVPPKSEQEKIANFLDSKCSEIDATSADIQKEIEILEQYKRSVITEAVTKGLNPDVEMKDSGIEWVGNVPDHWGVLANKYVMKKRKDICTKWNGENVLSLTMNGVIVRDLDNPVGKMPTTFDGYQFVYSGDLLMCLFDYDVTPRCVGIVKNDGVTSPAYSRFELKENATLEYFYYYYLMIDFTKELLHLAKNLRHSFTEEQLGALKVPLPPLDEQKNIATYLDSKCKKIESVIASKKQQLEVLDSYKKSLIYEYVTGKKEVPNEQ